MTKESAIELIKEALSAVLNRPISEIDSSQGLESYGVDSLCMVELVAALENKFGLHIFPEEFLGASSIEKLADAIVKEKGES